jgi:hypothetical protein
MRVKNSLIFVFLFLLGIFISSCSNVVCTTPYIISDEGCCLDVNEDENCDDEDFLEREDYFGEEIIYLVNESVENLGGEKEIENEEITKEIFDDYYLGCEDCSLDFVIYGDYQDSVTKKFNNEILPLLLEEYGELVKFSFMNYPKNYHRVGREAAESVYCAGEQGMYWDYHNRLFSEDFFTESDFNSFAADMGINVKEFDNCLKNRKYDPKIVEETNKAKSLRINSVPTYVINDQIFSGYRSFKFFKKILDSELKYSLDYDLVKKIITSAQGDGYFILPGIAVKDVDLRDSYYSNNLEPMTGKLYFSAEDWDKKDNLFSRDNARLSVDFEKKSSDIITPYSLELKKLLRMGDVGDNHYGGVASDLFFFGNTGRGTELLPRTYVHAYIWAEGAIYSGDKLIYDDLLLEFYVVKGIRENGRIIDMQEDDLEVYVFVKRPFSDMKEFEGGKLYLFWEKGLNFKSV